MNQFGPFVVLIALLAAGLAGLGAAVAWWNEETRRVRRGLRKVLGETPHALIVAPGRGRGAGFNFTSNNMAVAWDCGGWCLVYSIDELIGAELIVDGQVAARSWRAEPRRPLERVTAERSVVLRLVFDDPRHPDFALELWAGDAGDAGEAIEQGNRWIARTDSVFRRRPTAMQSRPATPRPGPPPQPSVAPPAQLAEHQELPFDAPAPWEDDEAEPA
jgi:hypothetical protein